MWYTRQCPAAADKHLNCSILLNYALLRSLCRECVFCPALSRHFRPATPSPALTRHSRPAAPSPALSRYLPSCHTISVLPHHLLPCTPAFLRFAFASSCCRGLSCFIATVLSPLLPSHRPAPPSAPAQVHQPFPDLAFTLFWYTSVVLSRSVDATLPYPVSSTRLIPSLPPPIVSASTTPYPVTVALPCHVLSAHLVSFSPCSARLRSALSYLRLVMPHSRFSLSYLPP